MIETIKIQNHNQAANYENGKTAEQKAAKWLKTKYGVEFNQKDLPFGKRTDGKIATHKFDLVSPDKQIVAEIKTHSGNVASAKILDTYVTCEMLQRVPAKTKVLIFSDLSYYKSFLNNSHGRIPRQIEIVCIADEKQPVLNCV